MHTWEITIIEIAEIEADLDKSSKERRGLVEIIAKAKGLMATIIIKIEE